MKNLKLITAAAVLLLVAAIDGCATQQPCVGTACKPDDVTTAAVDAAIALHPDLGPPSQVSVATMNHVVYLSGTVDSGYQRSMAESVAAHIDGVTKVVNTIGVSR